MDPFTGTLSYEPIPFEAPTTDIRRLSTGARVIFLVDHSLPLINIYGEMPHGYAHLPGKGFVAGYGLDTLMRTGGTARMVPHEVDLAIEERAIGLELEVGPRTTSFGLNSLSRHLGEGLVLLGDILRTPKFDPQIIGVWKGRQLDGIRRRNDRPGPIASRLYNKLMYPNHPLGRTLEEEDINALTVADLKEAHRILFRPNAMTIGICGAVDPDEMMVHLEELFSKFGEYGPEPAEIPPVNIRKKGGVFLVDRDLPQATLMVGQPGGVTVANEQSYFSTRLLNFILGGSGFTSRLTREMRTVRGYAYSARTSWGATVGGERTLYALTETRVENAIAALQLIHDVFQGFKDELPKVDEVQVAKDNMRNSFLFEFELPYQVVNRQVSYLTRGLPQDWFQQYLKGIENTSRQDVFDAAKAFLKPDNFTIVVVGPGDFLRGKLKVFGEVEEVALDV